MRITLIDACYLESAPGRPRRGRQVRFADKSAEAWAERVGELAGLEAGAGARLGAAVHSLRAVPPEGAELVARFVEGARAGRCIFTFRSKSGRTRPPRRPTVFLPPSFSGPREP